MNLDTKMKQYKNEMETEWSKNIKEEKIGKAIEKAKECFLNREEEKILPYRSFLYIQFCMIQKRWWIFQIIVLLVLWKLSLQTYNALFLSRSLGIGATLFIILLIPELWKNRRYQCMEIEATAYYSLRKIYAARMMLFGSVDLFMLTIFCIVSSVSLQMSIFDLLVQFLFPAVVTACICFGTLNRKTGCGEATAVGMSVIWSALWWCIVLNDGIYRALTIPMWIALFTAALVCMLLIAYYVIYQCDTIWEVTIDGIGNE